MPIFLIVLIVSSVSLIITIGCCLFSMLKANKEKRKKPYKTLVISNLILLVTIPFLINELYLWGISSGTSYFTLWGAEDVLAFYGSFLAFAGTVVLGIVAVWQNNKANETNKNMADLAKQANALSTKLNDRNIKASVRPFIIINRLFSKYEGNVISVMAASAIKERKKNTEDNCFEIDEATCLNYVESEFTDFYFFFSPNRLNFSHVLSDNQKKEIEEKYKCKNGALTVSSVSYFPFKLISIGNGIAINVTLRLYKESNFINTDFDVMNYALSLKNNVEYILGFYIEEIKECVGSYFLLIEYYDVLGNKYSQTHSLNLVTDLVNDEEKTGFTLNLEVKQEEK